MRKKPVPVPVNRPWHLYRQPRSIAWNCSFRRQCRHIGRRPCWLLWTSPASRPRPAAVVEATKMDEYVPMITPQIIANTNPRITSPPSTYSEISASKVVKDVMNVRLRVSLMDRFSTSLRSLALYLRKFLTDAVKHDHSIVKRVPHNRQQGCDNREVKPDLQCRKEYRWSAIHRASRRQPRPKRTATQTASKCKPIPPQSPRQRR